MTSMAAICQNFIALQSLPSSLQPRLQMRFALLQLRQLGLQTHIGNLKLKIGPDQICPPRLQSSQLSSRFGLKKDHVWKKVSWTH